MQAQDSLDNSLFSYQIGAIQGDDDASSAPRASHLLSDDVKDKLQKVLTLLNQDVGQLVKDAGPIRNIFSTLSGQVPEDLEEAVTPASFLEFHRIPVLKAQQRLADRSHHEQSEKERNEHKSRADDLQRRISILQDSRSTIVSEIDRLKARRTALMKELQEVGNALSAEEAKLDQLPIAIEKMESEKRHHAQQAYRIHKSLQPISGSADDDRQVISAADEIRLRAANAIRNFLRSV